MSVDVSVIIPVYNEENYISETLKSVLLQDFNNFEIIIVNNGSTDSSLEIIKNSLKDTNIPNKIINQENNGVSGARNTGIENANGNYLIFVDADDIIAKNHVSCLFNSIQNNDGAITEIFKTTESGEIIDGQKLHFNTSRISAKDLIEMELKMEIPFSFCQIMYKKELISEKFNENAVYGEDTEFALKNLINMNYLGICPKPTYFYRQRDKSATKRADFKRFEVVGIFENIGRYYEGNGYKELSNLIKVNRIPKAIFGNLMYFFHYNYDFSKIMDKMNELDLFSKLKRFDGEKKFGFKIKLFLLSPKIYYRLWKRFKDEIQ